MIRRPLDPRFNQAVREGWKVTTIRDTAWPVGVPIMFYNWTGLPYRSKQKDVACIVVWDTWPLLIRHDLDGGMHYSRCQLWITEGFSSPEEMDAWFRIKIKPGTPQVRKHLMSFTPHP